MSTYTVIAATTTIEDFAGQSVEITAETAYTTRAPDGETAARRCAASLGAGALVLRYARAGEIEWTEIDGGIAA
jgi:hypothetical protein